MRATRATDNCSTETFLEDTIMRRRNDGNRLAVWLAITVAISCAGGIASADFTFGLPVALEATINSGGDPWFDCISNDGLELYLEKPIGGNTMGDWNLFISTRATTNDLWSAPVKLGPPLNTSSVEGFACLSSDDLELYFASDRPGGHGSYDLWVSRRPTRFDSWGPPENLGAAVNTSAADLSPWITADGLELYFASSRPGGYGNHDIWVARRPTIEDNWGTPENLGPVVNSAAFDSLPCLSPGGLVLLFSDYPETSHSIRPGGLGQTDMWMSRRKSILDPWEPPVNLGRPLNSGARDCQPRLSPDADFLYFSSMRGGAPSGGFNIWQVPIIPLVDLNGDSMVEIGDLVTLIENWGQANPLCDIGPAPFGDGLVDDVDLRVLMSYWGQESYDATLIAHWKLDETEGNAAYDSILDCHGILQGDPVWEPTGGHAEGALRLDGVDDHVETPYVFDPGDGAFSVFAWIQGGAPAQVIVSQVGGQNWLMADVSDGALMTALAPAVSRQPAPLIGDVSITDGNWHRIAFVRDGATRALYVDGMLVAEDTQLTLAPCTGGLYIGCDKDQTPGTFFTGLIDDIRIYNRAVRP